ncbi:hypothetical protein ASN18_3020 [Candidatus Magnetominusculus xianensis]|uniref:Uncharacterized protein n=1 Tax=Candidatus Magnetominusculus xianensis TaxID=1748249 RepID=A0ABR5SBQ1_9BACT|nr:hypothetical protein ASN18_3020 [Candidatus Magnetominusculus xianensis]
MLITRIVIEVGKAKIRQNNKGQENLAIGVLSIALSFERFVDERRTTARDTSYLQPYFAWC